MTSIAVIGGGIMGISLGYFLSGKGLDVEVYESSPVLGGLAGSVHLDDGTEIDRFYHAILSSDSFLLQLCTDLGISDQLRFHDTRMGFYFQGKIFSMNNMVEFLRFPPLGWIDRFRLGLTVLYAQFIKDWRNLEGIGVEKWLTRTSGQTTYKNIWKPMLKAKFDGDFNDIPATYIWSRLVRMKSTRSGVNQKEQAGHLIGGFSSLISKMADKIKAAGGKIHLNTQVEEIVIENDRIVGICCQGQIIKYDFIVGTVQTPVFQKLIPRANQGYLKYLDQLVYLGIVAPILVLDRSLTGYWTLNITDDRFPFTGVIETTSYIDPKYVGGNYLVYLPKYILPSSEWQKMSDDEIKEIWLKNLEAMFPDFDRKWIRFFLVNRENYVEPIHEVNKTDLIPTLKTPIEDLFLATTAQIYPGLTNGESVTRHAKHVAEIILHNIKGDGSK